MILAMVVERGAFPLSVASITESNEEATLAVLALHDGLEGIDVGAADLVLLLDLDRVPLVT